MNEDFPGHGFHVLTKCRQDNLMLRSIFQFVDPRQGGGIFGGDPEGHGYGNVIPKVVSRCKSSLVRPEIIGIHDGVCVPLLGQETLPMLRKIRIDGIPRHDGVEVRGPSICLRPQDAS